MSIGDSREPILKRAERTELFPERLGEGTGWFPTTISTQAQPIKTVIRVPTAVVTYRIAGLLETLPMFRNKSSMDCSPAKEAIPVVRKAAFS
jgi:hypothetical protein